MFERSEFLNVILNFTERKSKSFAAVGFLLLLFFAHQRKVIPQKLEVNLIEYTNAHVLWPLRLLPNKTPA